MIKLETTEVTPEKKSFLELKGLKMYTLILVILGGAFIYLQANGISIISDSNTEHEGKQHTSGYYHK